MGTTEETKSDEIEIKTSAKKAEAGAQEKVDKLVEKAAKFGEKLKEKIHK